MAKFQIADEVKYLTPFTMYMEFILLNYNNFLKKHLKDEKITTKDFLYLFNIFYNKEISQKELADLMYVSEPNIAKMIKKLDSYGLIIKRKDNQNKNRNRLSLSSNGEKLVYHLINVTIQWETKVAKEYNIENMDEFKDLLCEISENSVDVE